MLLEAHMAGLLTKIEEEATSVHSENEKNTNNAPNSP